MENELQPPLIGEVISTRRGFWGTIFPDGLGRKALLALIVVTGFIAGSIVAIVNAFLYLPTNEAFEFTMQVLEPLGKMAMLAITAYFVVNARNGNGTKPHS